MATLLTGAALVTTPLSNAAILYQSGSPVAATSQQYALDAESYRLAKAVVKDLVYSSETYRTFLESLSEQEIENSELAAAIVEYYEHFVRRRPQKDERHRAIFYFGDSEAPQDEDLKPFHARCEEILMETPCRCTEGFSRVKERREQNEKNTESDRDGAADDGKPQLVLVQ